MIKKHENNVAVKSFCRKDSRVRSAEKSGESKRLKLNNPKNVRLFAIDIALPLRSVAFHPSGKMDSGKMVP